MAQQPRVQHQLQHQHYKYSLFKFTFTFLFAFLLLQSALIYFNYYHNSSSNDNSTFNDATTYSTDHDHHSHSSSIKSSSSPIIASSCNNNNNKKNNDKHNNKKSSGTTNDGKHHRRRYLLVPGGAGLNNFVIAMSNGARMAKRLNRTLLIHPCVHNVHTSSYSFVTLFQYPIYNPHCKTGVSFLDLYRLPITADNNSNNNNNNHAPMTMMMNDTGDTDARYASMPLEVEMAHERHDVWTSGRIKTCTMPSGVPHDKAVRMYEQCASVQYANEQYLFLDRLLYLKWRHVFDFSDRVYQLVHQIFDSFAERQQQQQRSQQQSPISTASSSSSATTTMKQRDRNNNNNLLAMGDSLVVHARLGNFANFCSDKAKECYHSWHALEPKIEKQRRELGVQYVFIITNEDVPSEIMKRNSERWFLVRDIIRRSPIKIEPMDENMEVALEMASGVLATYFMRNRFSTLSGNISVLRSRHDKLPNTTIMTI